MNKYAIHIIIEDDRNEEVTESIMISSSFNVLQDAVNFANNIKRYAERLDKYWLKAPPLRKDGTLSLEDELQMFLNDKFGCLPD